MLSEWSSKSQRAVGAKKIIEVAFCYNLKLIRSTPLTRQAMMAKIRPAKTSQGEGSGRQPDPKFDKMCPKRNPKWNQKQIALNSATCEFDTVFASFFCLRQRKKSRTEDVHLGNCGTKLMQVGEMSEWGVETTPLTTEDD